MSQPTDDEVLPQYINDLRARMTAYRQAADQEGQLLKDSHHALGRLQAWYGCLDADERSLADVVISEWAVSDDAALRFDALALIDDFKIAAAAPSLRVLAGRLATEDSPAAPFELKKVQRILANLG